MTQPPEAGDLRPVERAVRRAALAELICDYLRDGKTWCDEDGMVNGEHSLADAIMELDAPRSQAALSPAPSQGDVEADRDFLLARALNAGRASFADDRWTGMSSNALVETAFGGDGKELPSDSSDLAACYRTIMRMPPHRISERVLALLETGERGMIAKGYDNHVEYARKKTEWPGADHYRAALSDDDGKEGR